MMYTFKDLPVEEDYNGLWARKPIREKWLSYTYHIAVVGRNNFFSHSDGSGRDIWDPIYIIKDDLNRNDLSWSLRNKSEINDMKALFHDLNRVDIRISNKSSHKNVKTVHLDRFGKYTYSPGFSHFETSIDKKKWQKSDSQFIIKISSRPVTIRARAVNNSGVKGPVAKTTIQSAGI